MQNKRATARVALLFKPKPNLNDTLPWSAPDAALVHFNAPQCSGRAFPEGEFYPQDTLHVPGCDLFCVHVLRKGKCTTECVVMKLPACIGARFLAAGFFSACRYHEFISFGLDAETFSLKTGHCKLEVIAL